jgi:hypothetical protein
MLPIFALVDSGSPWTALAPMDSQFLRIPIKTLRKAQEHPRILFAGDVFWRLLLTDVELVFKDDKGDIAKFEMPSVSVLDPIAKKPVEEYKGIPSVIGVEYDRLFKTAKDALQKLWRIRYLEVRKVSIIFLNFLRSF